MVCMVLTEKQIRRYAIGELKIILHERENKTREHLPVTRLLDGAFTVTFWPSTKVVASAV